MGKYDEVIGNLTGVDDDTLNSTHGAAKARLDELKPRIDAKTLTRDELTELKELVPAVKALHTEVTTREADRAAVYAEAESVLAETEQPEQPEPPQVPETPQQPEQPERPDVEPQPEPEPQPAQEPQLIAASAGAPRPKTPPMGSVTKAAPKAPVAAPAMAITAAADVAGFPAGQNLEIGQVGKAMSSRLRAVAASSAVDQEPLGVATITAAGVPDERILRPEDSIERNTFKVHNVTSQQAITAAGGLCAPLAIDYSYGVWGVQGRPIKNALPGFQVARGGIQFRKDLSPMTNVAADGPKSATGFWTMQNDVDAADPADYVGTPTGPLKALWVVDCPSTVTAQVEAITLQIEFANITSRFDPETMQANTEAALVWHDRVAENHLLGQLQALSKYMEFTRLLGATRDLLVAFDKLQAYYRSVHRLSDNIRLRAVAPQWVRNLIRSDIARQLNQDGLSTLNISDAQIDAFFATRNINTTWHMDGAAAAQAGSGTGGATVPAIAAQQYSPTTGYSLVPDYPEQVDILLFPEGHFQHLDGGTLDLGIVRDAELVRRNRYRQFSESFEGVAARGVEALRLVANVQPTGAMSGTVAPGSAPGTVDPAW